MCIRDRCYRWYSMPCTRVPQDPDGARTSLPFTFHSHPHLHPSPFTRTECEYSSEPVPMFLLAGGNCTASQFLNTFGTGRRGRHPNVKMAIQLCHPDVGPHGPNRASLLMNPMYSIARTRQCPRKSCSPRQPMAAYMERTTACHFCYAYT